jgi:hypothetical protein
VRGREGIRKELRLVAYAAGDDRGVVRLDGKPLDLRRQLGLLSDASRGDILGEERTEPRHASRLVETGWGARRAVRPLGVLGVVEV